MVSVVCAHGRPSNANSAPPPSGTRTPRADPQEASTTISTAFSIDSARTVKFDRVRYRAAPSYGEQRTEWFDVARRGNDAAMPWESLHPRPDREAQSYFRHGVPFAAYVDPMEDDYRLSTLFDQVFSGRYRSSFADQRNRARLPIRRFVKDTNTVNLLPWIVAHYPEVPIIYLLRHPFAVSWSYTELGWRSDPLGRLLVNEHFGSHQAEFSAELIRQTFLYNVTLWCAGIAWRCENWLPARFTRSSTRRWSRSLNVSSIPSLRSCRGPVVRGGTGRRSSTR